MPPGIQTYAPGPGPQRIGCAVCGNHKSPTDTPLRKCSRCMNIFYCSRACQRSDWSAHKQYCSRPRPLGMQEQNDFENMLRVAFGGPDGTGMQLGNGMAIHIGPRPGEGSEEEGDDDEIGGGGPSDLGGDDGGWSVRTQPACVETGDTASGSSSSAAGAFRPSRASTNTNPTTADANLSSASVSEYHRLIDAFIVHIVLHEGFRPEDILTAGFPLTRFKHFLDLAEGKVGVLPEWWESKNRKECEDFHVRWGREGLGGAAVMDEFVDHARLVVMRALGEKIHGDDV